MKSFVYIVLVVLLATIAVEGYGPKIERRKPPHGHHHKPHHRGPHKPDRWSHHDDDDQWDDNSPIWDSDSRGRDDNSGSSDSYGRDDRDDRGDRDDRFPPDSYDRERDSSDSSGPSSSSEEDYRDWYHHPKRPHPRPTKRPPKPTRRPVPSPRPKPTTHRPIPSTHRPIPSTHRPIPSTHRPIQTTHSWSRPTLPPHPAHTKYTPHTRPTTKATTPQYTPRPTRTVGPFTPFTPRPTRPTWHPTPSTLDTTHWDTTIDTNTPTDSGGETTIDEEEFTTLAPEIEECIQNCLSTPEYNPVCGSNGQTYDNEGKLFCASSCGVNVTLRRRSVCPPPIIDYDDGSETPRPRPPPTSPGTTESNIARTTSLTAFDRCMRQCRIIPSFTPVCGSDFVTYMNIDRLKCAQSCGEVVEVLCEKPCAACGFNPATPKTPTTLRPAPTTQQTGRSTQEPDIKECIDACPKSTEDNPVCGTNQVTYKNPSHLLCAQLCGVGVAVVRYGRCDPRPSTTTTTEALPSTLSPAVRDCIRRCPVTTEYDPVCGTDGLTYSNLGNLHCSKFCGKDVDLNHKSRCQDEFDLGPDDGTTAQTTKDINGSKDQVTTLSPWRTTAETSSLFTSGTTKNTPRPTSPITKPTTKSTAGPSSSTYGFTIPSDILNDIFGPTTPANKPNKKDEDEDLDLDARYSNDTTK